jgi:hypothetical protein
MRDFFTTGMIRQAFPQLQRRLELANAYQHLFADHNFDGQLVLRDVIHQSGILEVAHDPGDSRFYDGKRAIGLHVLHQLRWSAGELMRLGEEVTYEQLLGRARNQGEG